MIMPPGEAGTYLVHFTGSKEHNVHLRGHRPRPRLEPVREGVPAPRRRTASRSPATRPSCAPSPPRPRRTASSASPLIEPELREDEGEIEAARDGRLPTLIGLADLRGDLPLATPSGRTGSTRSRRWPRPPAGAGHAYQVLTDHTMSLGIARGLDPERVRRAADDRGRAQRPLRAPRRRPGTAPPETPPEGFRLLHGCELEIRADGALDLPDEVLARFDVVVASLHVGRRQPREQLTARVPGGHRAARTSTSSPTRPGG